MADTLAQALADIDWRANILAFLGHNEDGVALSAAMQKIATWAFYIEQAEGQNPAICFIREMQIASMNSAILISTGLYKPAAASMRSLFEAAGYFSFFRTHLSEISTLTRNDSYFIDKSFVLKYHKEHTRDFEARQHGLGLITKIDKWYRQTSAIIHGQTPGSWVTYHSVSDVKFHKATAKSALRLFADCEMILRLFFLCTVAQDLWYCFDSSAKKKLLHSLSGTQKAIFELDAA